MDSFYDGGLKTLKKKQMSGDGFVDRLDCYVLRNVLRNLKRELGIVCVFDVRF